MTNKPQRFRKKPVDIEAMRLPEEYPEGVDPSSDAYKRNIDAAQVIHWLEKHLGRGFDPTDDDVPATGWAIDPGTGFLLIATLEGVMQAKPGDWIIRGLQGEFYPCKPDIFEATYDLVEFASAEQPAQVIRVTQVHLLDGETIEAEPHVYSGTTDEELKKDLEFFGEIIGSADGALLVPVGDGRKKIVPSRQVRYVEYQDTPERGH